MPSSRKVKAKAKAKALSATDIVSIAKDNPYIQRLIEDADLRENVRQALDSTRSAFKRLSNGKAPQKALFDDKKLQSDLRVAVTAIREASQSLQEAPRKQRRKARRFGRTLLIAGIGGGLALVGSEKLRSKVLDTLFGAEEEFEYTPPAQTSPTSPSTPVSAA
jgi:hypothetical protein